ncbi:unnamed protein product [Gordionus sp. m RMFG-2023]
MHSQSKLIHLQDHYLQITLIPKIMHFNGNVDIHQPEAPSTSCNSLIRKKRCLNRQSETHLRNICPALNKKNLGQLTEHDYNARKTQKGMTKRLAREFVNNTLGVSKKANVQPMPLTQKSTDKDAINVRTLMEQQRAASMVCQIQPMVSESKPLTKTDSDKNLWEELMLI